MEAVNFKIVEEGKHISGSKKRFVWTFKLKGQEYTVSLTISYRSKKYLVLLNDSVSLYRAKRTQDKDPFRYDFLLDNEALAVIEKEKRADLLYKARTFHSYLPHSVIHLTQAPTKNDPAILVTPIKSRGNSPPQAPNAVQYATVRPILAPYQPLEVKPRAPPGYTIPTGLLEVSTGRGIRLVRINGRGTLERAADTFIENDFPFGTDQSELIYNLVHKTRF
jgi:hypothetical protein